MSSRCCSRMSSRASEVERHAAQIVATLQQPLMVDGRVLTTSASVGASLYPDHAADAEGLLRAADVALFRAKELGRNRFALYSPALYDAAAQRFRLEQSLRRAVEGGRAAADVPAAGGAAHLRDDARSRRCCAGASPTAASPPPRNSSTSPKRPACIHELTDWILRTAATAAAAWRAQGWQRAMRRRSTSRRRSSSRATSSSTWHARWR